MKAVTSNKFHLNAKSDQLEVVAKNTMLKRILKAHLASV